MIENKSIIKYYTDLREEYIPTLSVGDWIKFKHNGLISEGRITVVGRFGYWINSHSMYNGNIRCPFGKENKL